MYDDDEMHRNGYRFSRFRDTPGTWKPVHGAFTNDRDTFDRHGDPALGDTYRFWFWKEARRELHPPLSLHEPTECSYHGRKDGQWRTR